MSTGVISFPRDRERVGEIVLGPDPADATFPVTAARLAGYKHAVVDAGFDWTDVPVAFVPTNARSEGAGAARILLQEHAVDCILATSDDLAFGVREVSGDVIVTGWDDSEAAESAGLTTVAQSLYEQGHDAARWVLGTLDEVPPATWSLKVRSSTR